VESVQEWAAIPSEIEWTIDWIMDWSKPWTGDTGVYLRSECTTVECGLSELWTVKYIGVDCRPVWAVK